MRILLVEDNRRLSLSLKESLVLEGYAVDVAFDGQEGQDMAEAFTYDAVILDVLLPRKDGLAVCRQLRRKGVRSPIIMLTARDSVDDRVLGLDSGADDYLIKPFAMNELLARLRSLLRRDMENKNPVLTLGGLVVDPASHIVTYNGREIDLPTKEYLLLEYFMRHPNRIITREMVIDHVWDYEFDGTSNLIEVYIRRLRQKIEHPFGITIIETVRGAGYRLRAREEL